jgi:hypothetical protein
VVLFVAVLVVVLAAGVAAAQASRRSTRFTAVFTAAVLGWIGVTGAYVALGATQSVAGLMVFFGLSNLAGLGLALSPIGAAWARAFSLWALVAFQGFRFPLEIALHWWAEDGTIPPTMTWSGSNADVVTGVLAIAAAPWANRPAVAWFVNIVGIVLLANVARVALLSSPVPFGWDVAPPLMLAMHLPYAWIAPVCVGGALCGHVVLTRRLLGSGQSLRGS